MSDIADNFHFPGMLDGEMLMDAALEESSPAEVAMWALSRKSIPAASCLWADKHLGTELRNHRQGYRTTPAASSSGTRLHHDTREDVPEDTSPNPVIPWLHSNDTEQHTDSNLSFHRDRIRCRHTSLCRS